MLELASHAVLWSTHWDSSTGVCSFSHIFATLFRRQDKLPKRMGNPLCAGLLGMLSNKHTELLETVGVCP